MGRTAPRRRWLTFAVAAPLVAACSSAEPSGTASTATTIVKSSATTVASSTPGSGVPQTTGTTATSPGEPTTANLDTKVWWQGFRYDLGELTYDPSARQLTIKTRVTNLGNVAATPEPAVTVTNGGAESTGKLATNPSITATKSVESSLAFAVGDDFTLQGAALVFTEGAGTVEAKVPLDGSSDKVTLEPIEQAKIPDPMRIGTVTVTIDKVELRWDLPADHSLEADAGTTFLVLTGSARNDGEAPANTNAPGITITTDAGTVPAKLLSEPSIPGMGGTKFAVLFPIREPVEGTWTLDVKDQPWGPDQGNVSGSTPLPVSRQKKGTTGTTR